MDSLWDRNINRGKGGPSFLTLGKPFIDLEILWLISLALYSVHVELSLCIALIHCAIHGYAPCAIDFSRGFWYSTSPCPFMFVGTTLLTASTSAVEWCKPCAHTSFLSEVIQVLTQREQGIVYNLFTLHKSQITFKPV